ncbi:MAG: CoxE, partial [Actinomycetota bacterium]|nr:CoxE [Actinomycetota bacterium]
MPPAPARSAADSEPPPGIAARLVEFGEELRAEGVGSGTAELLDAFAVLEQIPWTEPEDFREALAATLAKSQEDRRVFELVFERFFFRATEAAAIRENVREGGTGDGASGELGEVDLDMLRQQIAAALREGAEGSLRDLARLAIAAFGRRGEGSGVIGVDVQRIRRSLGLRAEAQPDLPEGDPRREGLPREGLRRFEEMLR